MPSNAGTGQPYHAICSRCRRAGMWRTRGRGWALVRTGRVKRFPHPRGGVRMLAWENHEYRCKDCGHVGWSHHVGILEKPLEEKPLTPDPAPDIDRG